MTQLSIVSIGMVYGWLMVGVVLFGVVTLRRRRVEQLELAYSRRYPPMPHVVFQRMEDTQETRIIELVPLDKRGLRHINPSEQVAIEIKPDDETLLSPPRFGRQSSAMPLPSR